MIQQHDTLTITLTIEDPLHITTAALPNGVVGVAYSVQLQATGGIGPYTWSATGLPAGLTLTSDGLLSGTPSASGSGSVVLAVTDTGA